MIKSNKSNISIINSILTCLTFTVEEANNIKREYGICTAIDDFVPKIMLGRQQYHSTAIRVFATQHPHLQIGVKVQSITAFQATYRGIDNLHAIISCDDIVHKPYNIVIFDAVGTYGINKIDFEKILVMHPSTKLIGIGN